MNDILSPPAGSRLSAVWTDGSPTILAAPARRSGGLAFTAAFLVFWLAGWSYAGFAVATKAMGGHGSWFEDSWLGGWVLGEAFALYFL